jgi:hypothetical protein
MKQREAMNPGNFRSERSAAFIQQSAIAAEISGYVDIGMKKEALQLTRKVLEKRRIIPDEFSAALRTVGVYASFKSFKNWKPKFEAAYNRQSKKFQREARSDMLGMYVSLKEWETALKFVSVSSPSSASDFFFGMVILLQLGKLPQAEQLAARYTKVLRLLRSDFDKSLFCCALGQFFAHKRRWDCALNVLQQAPLDPSVARNLLTGIVEIHLAQALDAVDGGIRLIGLWKQQHDSDLDLCLPGLETDLAVDAEKELRKFKRGIERLLPETTWKQLGIS